MIEGLLYASIAGLIGLYFEYRREVKRLDARINAMIALLKQRGIDLNDDFDPNWDYDA